MTSNSNFADFLSGTLGIQFRDINKKIEHFLETGFTSNPKKPEFRPEFSHRKEWKEWNRFLGGTWHLRSPTRSPQEKPVQGPSFSARLNTMQGTFRNLEEVPTPKTNMTTKNCAI